MSPAMAAQAPTGIIQRGRVWDIAMQRRDAFGGGSVEGCRDFGAGHHRVAVAVEKQRGSAGGDRSPIAIGMVEGRLATMVALVRDLVRPQEVDARHAYGSPLHACSPVHKARYEDTGADRDCCVWLSRLMLSHDASDFAEICRSWGFS